MVASQGVDPVHDLTDVLSAQLMPHYAMGLHYEVREPSNCPPIMCGEERSRLGAGGAIPEADYGAMGPCGVGVHSRRARPRASSS